jgi:hypothetical protein
MVVENSVTLTVVEGPVKAQASPPAQANIRPHKRLHHEQIQLNSNGCPGRTKDKLEPGLRESGALATRVRRPRPPSRSLNVAVSLATWFFNLEPEESGANAADQFGDL